MEVPLLQIDERQIARCVVAYNPTIHGRLAGQVPAEKWLNDDTAIRSMPRQERTWLLANRAQRKVEIQGIHQHGLHYASPALCSLVGDQVEVVFVGRKPCSIDLLAHGRWICTAV